MGCNNQDYVDESYDANNGTKDCNQAADVQVQWAEAHKKNFPFMLANADPMMGGRFPEAMPGANVPPAIINEIQIAGTINAKIKIQY